MHTGRPRAQSVTNGSENVFRKEGHFWTVTYAGQVVHLKDAKGLHDIARMLAHQGNYLCAADLQGAALSHAHPLSRSHAAATERARAAVTMRIRAALLRIEKEHPALGRHLARSIRTGTVCRYDPEVSTQWEL